MPWAKWTLQVFGLLAAFCLSALNPFNGDANIDNATAAAWSQLAAPFYRPHPGQDSIFVVVIDGATLEELQAGAPPTRQALAKILRRVAADQPKAIFLDFQFPYQDAGDPFEPLAATIADIRGQQRIPVFHGEVGALPGASLPRQGVVAISWQPQHTFDYPFEARLEDGAAAPLPATSLYRAWCAGRTDCSQAFLNRLDSPADLPPIAVQWNSGADASLSEFYDSELARRCTLQASHGPAAALKRLWLGLTKGALDKAEYRDLVKRLGLADGCPTHLSAPSIHYLEPSAEALTAATKGRIVLIGPGYPGAGDEIEPPGRGAIPGVYLHAMALDNLMTYGPGYKHWAPEIFLNVSVSDLLALVLAATALVAVNLAIHTGDPARRNRRVWWTAAACAAVILGLGLAQFSIFNMAPVDSLKVLAVVGLILGFTNLEEGLEQLLAKRTRGQLVCVVLAPVALLSVFAGAAVIVIGQEPAQGWFWFLAGLLSLGAGAVMFLDPDARIASAVRSRLRRRSKT